MLCDESASYLKSIFNRNEMFNALVKIKLKVIIQEIKNQVSPLSPLKELMMHPNIKIIPHQSVM